MRGFDVEPRNRYFEVLGPLHRECQSDQKIHLTIELDLSSAERLRRRLAAAGQPQPSYTALVVKAVALALRIHSCANRAPLKSLIGWRIVRFRRVDVSVAVERDRPGAENAAYVETIRDADCRPLGALNLQLRQLAGAPPEQQPRWRQFSWIVERLPVTVARLLLALPTRSGGMWVRHRGGAVLISSPAKYGVDLMTGVWPWPLGVSFGRVKARPWVVAGRVAVRPTMFLNLCFDRRILAGGPAARFLVEIGSLLEHAETRLEAGWEEGGGPPRPASGDEARHGAAGTPLSPVPARRSEAAAASLSRSR